ncbi:MAG: hypothetical protein Q8L54_07745 [Devosia sp.]|nr:hypothetical protein [Devosia sp.]
MVRNSFSGSVVPRRRSSWVQRPVVTISASAEAIPVPIPGSAIRPPFALSREDFAHRTIQCLDDVRPAPVGRDAESVGALLGQQVSKLAQVRGEDGVLRIGES